MKPTITVEVYQTRHFWVAEAIDYIIYGIVLTLMMS